MLNGVVELIMFDERFILYHEINKKLPELLADLLSSDKYPLKTLTKGEIQKILGKKKAVSGVYLMSEVDDDTAVYVGRSKNLAQRIGVDHRAIQKSQSTLGLRLWKQGIEGISCMKTSREYMYQRFNVRFLPIEDVYLRTVFEFFASIILDTTSKYNSFMEH